MTRADDDGAPAKIVGTFEGTTRDRSAVVGYSLRVHVQNGHTCELARGIDSSAMFSASYVWTDEIEEETFQAARRVWERERAACKACVARRELTARRLTADGSAAIIVEYLRRFPSDRERVKLFEMIEAAICVNCGAMVPTRTCPACEKADARSYVGGGGD